METTTKIKTIEDLREAITYDMLSDICQPGNNDKAVKKWARTLEVEFEEEELEEYLECEGIELEGLTEFNKLEKTLWILAWEKHEIEFERLGVCLSCMLSINFYDDEELNIEEQAEIDEKVAALRNKWEFLGNTIDKYGEDKFFSSLPCDCCGTKLYGDRYYISACN